MTEHNFDKFENVPWGFSENEYGDEFLPSKQKLGFIKEWNETKNIFKSEICGNPPKKNYATNKNWYVLDESYLEYGFTGPERLWSKNNKGYKCVSVVVDKFFRFGWTEPLKKTFKQ